MAGLVRDLAVAAECFVLLAWVRVALRLAPQHLLRGVLAPRSGGAVADAAAVAGIFNRVAARHPLSHHCMHRSLALQRVLARRGIAADLRIGLGRKPNLFPGHAWLEIDGVVVNDDPQLVSRYSPLTITETALGMAYQ
ncbi:MAG TPA: lasso peptide biosynthesis B2 protein [Thermoanaerobaculia bacterium]|nr:lasso peptide biosynthesis B2 protein [Thermoanaerobaculia bacterium]